MKKSAYKVFAENNECVDIQNFNNKYIVKKCWGTNAFVFEFPSKQSMAFLKDAILHKELFAIYHKDKKLYEFIFSPTTEKYTLSFDYIYDSKKFLCGSFLYLSRSSIAIFFVFNLIRLNSVATMDFSK